MPTAFLRPRAFALGLLLLPSAAAWAIDPPSSGRVDFTRDIRPILSDNCYHCHGNDEKARKAKLRLDTKEGLFSKHEDETPFVAGNLESSEAWTRVNSEDKDEMMPPPEEKKRLSPAQLATVKRWIEQGTPFRDHWAFQAPVRPALPAAQNSWWGRGPVDRFIAATLEARHLQPSPEAPKELLLRRVSFDLTGLPPSPAELDAFLADTAPDAYERAVDRLLASPAYGEQMARYWLDAARYGDTHGLHLDNERSMWPYRDWVVRAFNQNLPYDQFTTWQLAGDLLPTPTPDQLTASGFNRCNVTTSEGGAINEEFLFRYAVDRTETAVAVWMGLTAGCAVCHDHKFDPLSQKDFYSLYSFFSSAADPAMDGNASDTPPVQRLPTLAQEKALSDLAEKEQAVAQRIRDEAAKIAYVDPATLDPQPEPQAIETVWLDDAFPEGAHVQSSGGSVEWITAETGPVQSGARAIRRKAEGPGQDYFDSISQPFYVPSKGKIFVYVWLDPANPPKAVMLQWHYDGGWNRRANWGDPATLPYGEAGRPENLQIGDLPKLGEWARLEVDLEAMKLNPGTRIDGLAFSQLNGTVVWDHAGVAYESDPPNDPQLSQLAWEKANQEKPSDKLPAEIQQIFRAGPPEKRTPEQSLALRQHYLAKVCSSTRETFAPMQNELTAAQEEKKKIEGEVPKTLVMHELEPRRPAFVMIRGQYNKPGEPVQPGTPAIFPPLKPEGAVATRLDLAKWLVSPEHPLTARVAVNRFWQQFFGLGMVKTSNDFGAQGEAPSHPELLDWLAVEFRESGWDVKRLVRVLVTSAAYRQDSRTTPEALENDPENRLLSHGPRFRLDAEEIRDNALFVSGLIDLTLGGKGVRPYQPERIWEPVGFVGSNTGNYTQDHGSALYRRSLYTFWKRTAPPPNMMSFDTPSRESYCTRRERSDTPLQALVTMNDVQQFEAARALGQRMMLEGGAAPAERIAYGFRVVTARRPLDPEREVLQGLYERQLARYQADPAAAKLAIGFGESKPKPELEPGQLAAYTLVANVLLNLDETLTKN